MPSLKRDRHEPMPRDERGWRVAPAPDGRGMPDSPAPKPHRSRGFLLIVLILLALNWGSLLLFQPGAPPRVTGPFSPYFLHAVRSNQAASISSKGDTVGGTLRSAVRYPASSATAISTRRFSTELPAFANDNRLAQLLESHGVQIDATSATQSTPLGVSLLLGFGPTLLLVGLFVLLFRRAAGGGAAGALGGFGRSQAEDRSGENLGHVRRRGRDR